MSEGKKKECFSSRPCLSVYPFVMSICLCVCLFVPLSVCLIVPLSVCQSCLAVCLSVCPSVSVCLSVCLWLNVCKETVCELYLCCTGWECGLLTVWPCSSPRSPGDFHAYNQVKKKFAIVKEKCKILTTVHYGAKSIWSKLALIDVWKWEISWPSSVSLRTFNP